MDGFISNYRPYGGDPGVLSFEHKKIRASVRDGVAMRRRDFITLLGGTIAWPLAARAQQPRKLPRIGVLISASPPHPFADAFRQGLHTLGYSEGQNIAIEFRYTEGRERSRRGVR